MTHGPDGGLLVINNRNDDRRLWWSKVRRNGGCCRPRVACGVSGVCSQRFAINFWWGQRQAKVALTVGNGRTKDSVALTDGHRAAWLRGAADGTAIIRHDEITGGCRRRGVHSEIDRL
ncbi:Uncharacterised protein [Enterobacter cloacae]|uniref:Uncharacterized protein n=1 Tax=Enterobacter cloacae TaxID=550 RepID=A0A144JU04_ENTCL|nr:Uncharacterised protein [Enterobacter cloacae]